MTFLPAGTSTGISRRRSNGASPPGQHAGSARQRTPAGRSMAPPADDWVNRSYLEFGAFPTAVPCSRLHTRQLLWEWGLSAVTDTAELIVSELVTNALRASGVGARARPGYDQQPRYIGLLVAVRGVQVLVAVWDASEDPPVPAPAEPDAATGRGLLLVGALCSGWGFCYPAEDPVPAELSDRQGKVVWGLIGSR